MAEAPTKTMRTGSLRRTTLVITAVTTLALTAGLGSALRTLFLNGYVDLERDAARKDLERVRNSLRDETSSLETTTRDYSVWDEPYAWMESREGTFVDVNFVDETFRQNRLSLVMMVANDASVAFGKAWDLRGNQVRRTPGLEDVAPRSNHPLRHPSMNRGTVGAELVDGIPMLLSSRPILTSEGKGPPHGSLILGRALDESARTKLSELTQFTLRFVTPVELAQASPLAMAHFRASDTPFFEAVDDTQSRGYVPVRDFSEKDILYIEVPIERAVWQRGVEAAKVLLISVAIACLVFGLAMMLLLERLVVRRVLRLSTGVMRVAKEANHAMRVTAEGGDEVGQLADSINGMLGSLEELTTLLEKARLVVREAFGRYVSEEVAEAILARPDPAALGGEVREVTVFFSDLRGYSTISERLTPPEVVGLLNEYFGAMSEIIVSEGGCVIEFLGDAILAVFGAPNDLPDQADHAVKAALRMRAKTEELNRAWDERGISKHWKDAGIPALASRIGIHAGRVVAGNLGSKRRMKYAVIGDTVNTASRVEGLNNGLGTDILVTLEAKVRLSPAVVGSLVDLGEHKVKGRDNSVHVFKVEG